MGKNAGMREEDAQWTSSQKAAILVLLTTGDLLHQQAYQVFMIKVFLFSSFFFSFFLLLIIGRWEISAFEFGHA